MLWVDPFFWPDDTVTYSYNNRLRSTLSLLAPNASPWTQSYGYDSARRITSLSSPAGSFGYVYDPLRNLQLGGVTLPGGALITNKFDTVARLLSTTLRNSSGSTLNAHSYAYDLASQRTWLTNTAGDYRNYLYDNIGQLQGAHANESGGTPRAQEQFGYAYDAAGNLSWHTNNTLTQSIAVNSLNELQGLTNTGTLTVEGTTTSAATNVTVWGTGLSSAAAAVYSSDNSWARTNVSLPNGNATYNASAQDNLGRTDTNSVSVTLPNTLAFQYDANGNLTNDGYRSFAYDDENQLISVVVTNGPGPSTRSDFAYDGLMRRRLRTEMIWNGSNWSTNQIMRYVYDGSVVIQERDGNNIPLVTYTRGRDLSGSLQGAGGIGGVLARTDMGLFTVAMPSAHAYYHADGNGNITCLVNTNQAIVAKYLYDPFGALIDKFGQLADVNHIGFSSKEFHANSGLYYYGLRFYDPLLQRWLNRDPIGEFGGANLYSFTANGPVNLYDPLGLDPSLAQLFLHGVLQNGINTVLSVAGTVTSDTLNFAANSLVSELSTLYQYETDPLGFVRSQFQSLENGLQAVADAGTYWGRLSADPCEQRRAKEALMAALQDPKTYGHAIFAAESFLATGLLAGPEELATEGETALLQTHVDNAVARLQAEGLTPAQKLALVDNPGLKSAFEGERIDYFVRQSIADDPALGHLELTPRGKFGPDVFDPATQRWWDVTTPAQWEAHSQKYWLFGDGTPLFTK